MPTIAAPPLPDLVEDLRRQIEALTRRVAELEHGPAPVPAAPTLAASAPLEAAAPVEIPEDELIAIAAAVAAYMGVRAHIRQIRLIGSTLWAQEGRASIQASHRLYS